MFLEAGWLGRDHRGTPHQRRQSASEPSRLRLGSRNREPHGGQHRRRDGLDLQGRQSGTQAETCPSTERDPLRWVVWYHHLKTAVPYGYSRLHAYNGTSRLVPRCYARLNPLDFGEFSEYARLRRFDQHTQGVAQHGELRHAVMGSTDDLAVGVPREEGAWRTNEQRWFAQRRERDRGDTTRLEFTGDQSHGLVANRSDGNEQDGVGMLLDNTRGEGRSEMIHNLGPIGEVAAEAEVGRGQPANLASGAKLAQTVQREDAVGVGVGGGVVIVLVGQVTRGQVSIHRNRAPGEIAAQSVSIEGLLTREVQAAAADQGEVSAAKVCRRSCPGYWSVFEVEAWIASAKCSAPVFALQIGPHVVKPGFQGRAIFLCRCCHVCCSLRQVERRLSWSYTRSALAVAPRAAKVRISRASLNLERQRPGTRANLV